MRFISLDLSTTDTGYAIFENDKLITYGSISFKIKDTYKRIILTVEAVQEMLSGMEIDHVVFEDSFSGTNKRVVVILNRLAGGIIWVADRLGVSFSTYPPKSVKKFITGNGNANKGMVIEAINQMYNIDVSNDNIADAIAIGQTFVAEHFVGKNRGE